MILTDFYTLDRLIAAGWGDTPQCRIPAEIYSAAEGDTDVPVNPYCEIAPQTKTKRTGRIYQPPRRPSRYFSLDEVQTLKHGGKVRQA